VRLVLGLDLAAEQRDVLRSVRRNFPPDSRKEYHKDAPDLSVKSLTERESSIPTHFSEPQVHYVGSLVRLLTVGAISRTACLRIENGLGSMTKNLNPSGKRVSVYNRERLVALLRETADAAVELCGVWDADFDFTTRPAIS